MTASAPTDALKNAARRRAASGGREKRAALCVRAFCVLALALRTAQNKQPPCEWCAPAAKAAAATAAAAARRKQFPFRREETRRARRHSARPFVCASVCLAGTTVRFRACACSFATRECGGNLRAAWGEEESWLPQQPAQAAAVVLLCANSPLLLVCARCRRSRMCVSSVRCCCRRRRSSSSLIQFQSVIRSFDADRSSIKVDYQQTSRHLSN